MRKSLLAPALALLALLLAACTVTVVPGEGTRVQTRVSGRVTFGLELDEVIREFQPTRGHGATYYVGDTISFRIRTDRDGFVTLSAIDPDGSVYVFARNLYVEGGYTQVLSGTNPRTEFLLTPPRGPHRVRASFTPDRTDVSRVTYRGRRGDDAWTNSIVVELRPYDVRDIAETSFYLR